MSNIKIRVKQDNINEAKVTFECKPEDAFRIIEDIAREHEITVVVDAEGMSVASMIAMCGKLKASEIKGFNHIG